MFRCRLYGLITNAGLFEYSLVVTAPWVGRQAMQPSRGHPAEHGQARPFAPTVRLARTTEATGPDSGGLDRTGDDCAQQDEPRDSDYQSSHSVIIRSGLGAVRFGSSDCSRTARALVVNKLRLGVMLMSKLAGAFLGVLSAIAISAALLTTSSNGLSTVPNASTPSCLVPHGSGPGYNASIGNQQNGKSVCITIGERLLVVLSAGAPNAAPWRGIHVSKTTVLQIAPLTLMFSRGTTGMNFKAVHLGTVQLTAQRPACAPVPSGAATCDAIQLWRATVIVRASPNALPRPSGTGVYGIVTAGPTCPVERVGQPCPPRPVAAEVDVRNAAGNTVASTHTDSAGRYAVSVSPGSYELLVITGTMFPRCPSSSVTVTSGSPVRTDISCDTGIR